MPGGWSASKPPLRSKPVLRTAAKYRTCSCRLHVRECGAGRLAGPHNRSELGYWREHVPGSCDSRPFAQLAEPDRRVPRSWSEAMSLLRSCGGSSSHLIKLAPSSYLGEARGRG